MRLLSLLLGGLLLTGPVLGVALSDAVRAPGVYDPADHDEPGPGALVVDAAPTLAPLVVGSPMPVVASPSALPDARDALSGFPRRFQPRAPPPAGTR
jgi:hypothetical protein